MINPLQNKAKRIELTISDAKIEPTVLTFIELSRNGFNKGSIRVAKNHTKKEPIRIVFNFFSNILPMKTPKLNNIKYSKGCLFNIIKNNTNILTQKKYNSCSFVVFINLIFSLTFFSPSFHFSSHQNQKICKLYNHFFSTLFSSIYLLVLFFVIFQNYILFPSYDNE